MQQNRIHLDPLKQAIRHIKTTWGDEVIISPQNYRKWGKNVDFGTSEETIWIQGGTETLATGNDIDTISSSDAGDDQAVVVEGHTLNGSALTFVRFRGKCLRLCNITGT